MKIYFFPNHGHALPENAVTMALIAVVVSPAKVAPPVAVGSIAETSPPALMAAHILVNWLVTVVLEVWAVVSRLSAVDIPAVSVVTVGDRELIEF